MVVAIVILLIPLAATVYISLNDSDVDITASLSKPCDLHHSACQAVFSRGGTVTLSIEPRPIRALNRLHIQVQLKGIKAQSVLVDFRGVNMNMGYNRPVLKPVTDGHYVGGWVLASCGLEKMVWQATVLIESNGKKLAAPFPLVTSKQKSER